MNSKFIEMEPTFLKLLFNPTSNTAEYYESQSRNLLICKLLKGYESFL